MVEIKLSDGTTLRVLASASGLMAALNHAEPHYVEWRNQDDQKVYHVNVHQVTYVRDVDE